MRTVLLAVGSRGDVQPFVELGAGLAAAGVDVVVATHPPYRDLVERRGLPYFCIGENSAELFESSTVLLMGETGQSPIAWVRTMRNVTRDLWDDLVPDCVAACEDADAVIYTVLGFPGISIAEKRGIPSIGAPLQPVSATRAFPNINLGTSTASFGSFGNLASHVVGEQMSWLPVRKLVQDWRRDALGLPKVPLGGQMRKVRKDRGPVVYGFSPTLVPHPPDWGDWIRITGYWFGPPTDGYQPPPDLEDFLEDERPTVFAGFGSVRVLHAEALFDAVCTAARRHGAKVVATSAGWLGKADPPGEDVYVADEVPHDWLFGRVDALVHHGGSGTTHHGARAGVPAVLVPTFGDQFFWAQRVALAGAGVAPITRKKVDADRLTEAIGPMLRDPEVRRRAEAVGASIRTERGVEDAVATLQRWLP